MLRGSSSKRAGASASPECGPEPVTSVPSSSTTTVSSASARAVQTSSGRTAGAVGPSGSPTRHSRYVDAQTSPIETRKCAATVAGFRWVRTVMPPSTAWTTTPTSGSAATATSRRGRCRRRTSSRTTTSAASATIPTTDVSVRLPNSMYLWMPCGWCTTGVYEPGTHSGQVGQPSPEPVSRTSPPVTTMPIWTTRLATSTGCTQRRAASGTPGRVAAGVGVVAALTTSRVGARPHPPPPGRPGRRRPRGPAGRTATYSGSADGAPGSAAGSCRPRTSRSVAGRRAHRGAHPWRWSRTRSRSRARPPPRPGRRRSSRRPRR